MPRRLSSSSGALLHLHTVYVTLFQEWGIWLFPIFFAYEGVSRHVLDIVAFSLRFLAQHTTEQLSDFSPKRKTLLWLTAFFYVVMQNFF